VQPDGPRQHYFFKVAAFLDQVFERVSMGNPRHVLLDDGKYRRLFATTGEACDAGGIK